MRNLAKKVPPSVVSMLLACAAVPVSAQRVDPDRIIDFHVNLEEVDRSVGGSMREGGRYTLSVRGKGTYVFTGVVADEDAERVVVTVLHAPEMSTEHNVVETVRATAGMPAPLSSLPQTSMVIERIRRAQVSMADAPLVFASTAAVPALRRSILPANCCLSCDGYTGCGCAVQTACGNCCISDCCRFVTPVGPPEATAMNWLLPTRSFAALARTNCHKPVPDQERLFTNSGHAPQKTLLGAHTAGLQGALGLRTWILLR